MSAKESKKVGKTEPNANKKTPSKAQNRNTSHYNQMIESSSSSDASDYPIESASFEKSESEEEPQQSEYDSSDNESSVSSPPSEQSNQRRSRNQAIAQVFTLQTATKVSIAPLPFLRLVREIMKARGQDLRIQSDALACLREASELHLNQFIEESYTCFFRRNRINAATQTE